MEETSKMKKGSVQRSNFWGKMIFRVLKFREKSRVGVGNLSLRIWKIKLRSKFEWVSESNPANKEIKAVWSWRKANLIRLMGRRIKLASKPRSSKEDGIFKETRFSRMSLRKSDSDKDNERTCFLLFGDQQKAAGSVELAWSVDFRNSRSWQMRKSSFFWRQVVQLCFLSSLVEFSGLCSEEWRLAALYKRSWSHLWEVALYSSGFLGFWWLWLAPDWFLRSSGSLWFCSCSVARKSRKVGLFQSFGRSEPEELGPFGCLSYSGLFQKETESPGGLSGPSSWTMTSSWERPNARCQLQKGTNSQDSRIRLDGHKRKHPNWCFHLSQSGSSFGRTRPLFGSPHSSQPNHPERTFAGCEWPNEHWRSSPNFQNWKTRSFSALQSVEFPDFPLLSHWIGRWEQLDLCFECCWVNWPVSPCFQTTEAHFGFVWDPQSQVHCYLGRLLPRKHNNHWKTQGLAIGFSSFLKIFINWFK